MSAQPGRRASHALFVGALVVAGLATACGDSSSQVEASTTTTTATSSSSTTTASTTETTPSTPKNVATYDLTFDDGTTVRRIIEDSCAPTGPCTAQVLTESGSSLVDAKRDGDTWTFTIALPTNIPAVQHRSAPPPIPGISRRSAELAPTTSSRCAAFLSATRPPRSR